jgi:hypothetical protein
MQSDEENKKIPKIVIPKLILKINKQTKESQDKNLISTADAILETPSPISLDKKLHSEFFSNLDPNFKKVFEDYKRNFCIPFDFLIKKINQNSYRNLEHIIEL